MEVSPPSARDTSRHAEKAPAPSVNTLVARATIFATTQEVDQATPEAQLQATSQPTTNVGEAVEELKLFVPRVDPALILYRKGLVSMRLNKEAGKGEPPVVVMNNDAWYFGDALLPFESTKFGSTLRASRMVEPGYMEGMLELQPVELRPTVEIPEDGSSDDMMRFLDLSTCSQTPMAEHMNESEPRAANFHEIDDLMSKDCSWWKPLKDVQKRDDAELDIKLERGILDLDDRALELEPMTIDAY